MLSNKIQLRPTQEVLPRHYFTNTERVFFLEREMKEEWRPVVGYEGIYNISNKGRVKKLNSWKRNHIMKQYKNNHGYMVIYFTINNISKRCKIHRLVAMAFIGMPKHKEEINHRNGIKHDNRLENLEWVTHQYNCLHAARVLKKKVGEKCYNAKLSNKDVRKIRQMMKDGIRQASIARMYSVNRSTIAVIKTGVNWKYVD